MAGVAAGWYPDPQESGLLRWWNGTGWTEHTRSGPVPGQEPPLAPPRPPLGNGWLRLARTLQGALVLMIVLRLATIVASAVHIRMIAGWIVDASTVDVEFEDLLLLVEGALQNIMLVALVCVAALLITWLYQAHRSDRMDPSLLRHASGWAIGGWFVPLLNLWRPPQMVQDVIRGCGRPANNLVVFWWVSFLIALVPDRLLLVTRPDQSLEWPAFGEAVVTWYQINIAADLTFAATCVLTMALVRNTTRDVMAARPQTFVPPADVAAG